MPGGFSPWGCCDFNTILGFKFKNLKRLLDVRGEGLDRQVPRWSHTVLASPTPTGRAGRRAQNKCLSERSSNLDPWKSCLSPVGLLVCCQRGGAGVPEGGRGGRAGGRKENVAVLTKLPLEWHRSSGTFSRREQHLCFAASLPLPHPGSLRAPLAKVPFFRYKAEVAGAPGVLVLGQVCPGPLKSHPLASRPAGRARASPSFQGQGRGSSLPILGRTAGREARSPASQGPPTGRPV